MSSPKQTTIVGQSHTQPQLSRYEKLHLFGLFAFLIFTKIVPSLLYDLYHARVLNAKTLKRAFVRNVGSISSAVPLRASQSMQKPTGETIAHTCLLKRIQHDRVPLFCGEFAPANLHFIGCGKSQPGNIMMYLHGGGYVFPLTTGDFGFAEVAAKAAHANLAILEYGLAPGVQYPGQLAQAVAAIMFLLQHHTPSEILIGGDSGGGNLTLAILSHLRSPHPDIPSLATPSQPAPVLRGAFCISPRCSNKCDSASFASNAGKDIVGVRSMNLFTSNWQPADEVWAAATRGDRTFWSQVAAQRVLLLAGENEVYRDDIETVAGLMGTENKPGADRQLTVCPGEIHVQCVLDLGMGIETGYMLTAVLEWLRSLP